MQTCTAARASSVHSLRPGARTQLAEPPPRASHAVYQQEASPRPGHCVVGPAHPKQGLTAAPDAWPTATLSHFQCRFGKHSEMCCSGADVWHGSEEVGRLLVSPLLVLTAAAVRAWDAAVLARAWALLRCESPDCVVSCFCLHAGVRSQCLRKKPAARVCYLLACSLALYLPYKQIFGILCGSIHKIILPEIKKKNLKSEQKNSSCCQKVTNKMYD